jgi:uncharacterized membrane protein
MRAQPEASPSDRDPGARARALLGLGLVAASIALALEQMAGDWTRPFVTTNAFSRPQRTYLLAVMLASAVAGIGIGVVLLRLGKGAGAERLSRVARLAAPLALLGLVPGLVAIDPWGDALVLALSLGAFVLAAESLFRLAFGAWQEIAAAPANKPEASNPALLERARARVRAVAQHLPPVVRRYGPAAIVVGAAIFYAAYMGFFTVRNHHKLGTYTWDLSHLDNEFWNALHGRPFRNTMMFRQTAWGNVPNHFQPTIFALLPFYALYPRAEALLVLQAVIVAAGAIPLYRFAARHLSRALAVVIAFVYLLYPPTHGAQLFDFHFQPIAAALLLAAIDCLDARRMRLFWVFLLLAIGCREDVSAGTAMIGLFLILAGRRSPFPFRTGVAIFAVSAAYFVALRFLVMPGMGSGGFADYYQRLLPEGEPTPVGIVKTLVTNPLYTFRTLLAPEKLRYGFQILAPLAFLPLRRPALALLLLPGCFFTLLTTEYGPPVEIFFHYSSTFVGYMFPATALALVHLGQGAQGLIRRRAATATLVIGTLLATAAWGAIPPRHKIRSSYGWMSFDPPTPAERQRLRDLRDLAGMVPKTAILAVSDREGPHVSNRYECWNISNGFEGADYVLYTTVNAITPDTQVAIAAERAGYVRIAERSGLILLKRPGLP